ncbi:endolytic transglycosylase MltG [Roseovarius sp. SCSIO 43702]|uniref:endolytic transglycosylase MltG n=1 Tax=Roseovarius sp. SCSIO 43702 TaxID=2823043 RepID=UPI001C737011|nr:endolytic transglycosylase MltG [Roseovarius sp. SCSIO 43702]QYX56028.1 endolytic transglycosylase MltG [Roseovarius sp. SCSIO 43702]
MWRHIASNALTFFVVIAFLLGGAIIWGQAEYTAEGPLDEPVCLRVKSGANMRTVSRDLAEQGAITYPSLLRIGADYADKTQALKAGSWLIPEGASMSEIVDLITRGGASTCGTEVVYRIGVTDAEVEVRELDPATDRFVEKAEFTPGEDEPPAEFLKVREEADTRYRVAIAEGATSWQIANALKSVDVLEGEIEAIPPEGMLAPRSYEVREGDDRAGLLNKMQEAQEAILAAAWEDRDPNLPLETPEDLLKLASIVEKETGIAEERGRVASVFVNRLNRGMRLQTDPTVIYGITEGQGTLGRGLRQSELRAETPWNTYVIDGLPATPIANPGEEAIRAAANPDETDFVFFVADGTGGHAFAETLEEHNENVARWREIEAERANQ